MNKNILEGKELTITEVKKRLDGQSYLAEIIWKSGNKMPVFLWKYGERVMADFGEGFCPFLYKDCQVAKSISFNRPVS